MRKRLLISFASVFTAALVWAAVAVAHTGFIVSLDCKTAVYQFNGKYGPNDSVHMTVTANGDTENPIAEGTITAPFEGPRTETLSYTLTEPGEYVLVADATWASNGRFTTATVTCVVPEPPPPVDVCPRDPGNQPPGSKCRVDLCPNIAGFQLKVPKDKARIRVDGRWKCVRKYNPDATIRGPYDDPWYFVTLNNTGSFGAVTYTVRYDLYGGGMTQFKVRVPAGKRVNTYCFHVDGYSTITVKARYLGRDHLVDREQAAAPGWYRHWPGCG